MVKQDGRGRGELELAFTVDFLRHDLVVGVFAFLVVTVVYRHGYHIRLPPTQKKGEKQTLNHMVVLGWMHRARF